MSRPGHTRLSAARDAYLKRCSVRLSAGTVEAYRITLERLLAHTKDLYTENLRPHHVEGFLASLRAEHRDGNGVLRPSISARSFNNYIGRLRPFTKWLLARGMTKTDLMADCYRMKEPREIRLSLDPEQVWDLLDSTELARDRGLMALAVQTALRASEILTLTLKDVDLDHRRLKVTIWKTQQEDVLPLTPLLVEELTRWLAAYALDTGKRHHRMLLPTDYLFPSLLRTTYAPGYEVRDGRRQRAITPRGYDPTKQLTKPHEIVQAGLTRLGLDDAKAGVHTLRRTAARIFFDSLSEQRGHDGAPRTVSALLHHSSAQTTEVYLSLSSEKALRDRVMLNEGFMPARQQPGKVISLH